MVVKGQSRESIAFGGAGASDKTMSRSATVGPKQAGARV